MARLLGNDSSCAFQSHTDTPRLGVLFLFVPLLGIATVWPITTRHAPRLGVSIVQLIGPRPGPITIDSTMASRLGSLIVLPVAIVLGISRAS